MRVAFPQAVSKRPYLALGVLTDKVFPFKSTRSGKSAENMAYRTTNHCFGGVDWATTGSCIDPIAATTIDRRTVAYPWGINIGVS